jgi:hypothetical protein
MTFSQALRNIILIQTTMMLVHGEKGSMDSPPTAFDNNRALKDVSPSKDDRYPYSRNYVAVIEPENFVTLSGSGDLSDAIIGGASLQGSSIVEFGNVYDPADLAVVNKLNGVELGDPGVTDATEIIGKRYAGDRQPKFPIPPGDRSYFFHGGTYVHNPVIVFISFCAHRIVSYRIVSYQIIYYYLQTNVSCVSIFFLPSFL